MPGADDVNDARERCPPSPDGYGAVGQGESRPGLKLTYDDFLLFPDDGNRHELIDGEHYVTPSPTLRHQRISRRLLGLIDGWLQSHPLGEIFHAPLDVILSNIDVLEPDLLYVSNERAGELLAGQHVTGAPDLVIEIGSPGTRQRDETIERRGYEQFGVREYWIVDPETDVVRIHRRDGDSFARPIELSRETNDVLTTPPPRVRHPARARVRRRIA
jgi:Uma2 family endonuclease